MTQFASGYWVGIELDAPLGKNNGAVKGETYFTCPDNCGLFVKPSQLRILEDAQPMKDSDLVKTHRAHKMYITRVRIPPPAVPVVLDCSLTAPFLTLGVSGRQMVLNLSQALSLAEQYDAKINNNGAALTDAEVSCFHHLPRRNFPLLTFLFLLFPADDLPVRDRGAAGAIPALQQRSVKRAGRDPELKGGVTVAW